MHNKPQRRSPLRITWSLVLATTFCLAPLHAQSPIYNQTLGAFPDDALVQMGNTAFTNYDYLSAAMLFFAYLQRDPALLHSDAEFRAEFFTDYNYSRDQLTAALATQAQAQQQGSQPQPGSTVSGLGRQRPQPIRLPPALQLPPKTPQR